MIKLSSLFVLPLFLVVGPQLHFARAEAPNSSTIPLNQDHEGELGGDTVSVSKDGTNGHGFTGYAADSTIELKARMGVTLVARVVGSDRRVAVFLIDNKGTRLGESSIGTTEATLTIDEVSYSGEYKIEVISDRVGVYTIRANAEEEETEQSIEAKISSLKAELAVQELKLKELREKSAQR